MILSDLLKASQGMPDTSPVGVEIAGIPMGILSAEVLANELVLVVSTPHTIGMNQAQLANKSSLASLKLVNLALTSAQTERDKLAAKRVADFVSKGMVHVPPHGEDEAKLLQQIQAGDI